MLVIDLEETKLRHMLMYRLKLRSHLYLRIHIVNYPLTVILVILNVIITQQSNRTIKVAILERIDLAVYREGVVPKVLIQHQDEEIPMVKLRLILKVIQKLP